MPKSNIKNQKSRNTAPQPSLAGLTSINEEFALIANSAPLMIWMSEPDMLCSFFNKTWLDFRGRTIEEELGNGWAEGVHPDDLAQCLEIYQSSFKARRPFKMKYRLKRFDGQYRLVLDHGVPRYGSKNEFLGYIGSCLNITERKQTGDKLLKSSEEPYRAIMDQSPLAIALLTPQGQIFSVNKAWMQLLGFNQEEAVQVMEKYNIFTDKEVEAPGVMPLIKKAFAGETVILPPIHYKAKNTVKRIGLNHLNPNEIWVQCHVYPVKNENQEVLFVVSANVDMTDQKRVQEKLLRSEQRFRDMMEQSPLPITILSPEGQILQVNSAWYRQWGLNHEEGERVFAKYNILTDKEAEAQGVMPLIKNAFAGETVILPPMHYKAKNTVKRIGLDQLNPNTVWVQCHYFSVKDDHQKVKFVVCTNLDLTKQKQAEEKTNQIRSELIQATRRSTMGELTAALAHELNQPLAAIMTNAQTAQRFLKKKKTDTKEIQDILNDIIKDDDRAKEMIIRLRSMMNKDTMKLKELDINDIIKEVVALVSSDSIIKRVNLKLQLEKKIPKILGDQIQLQQVLINLVLNGFEAMINEDTKQIIILSRQDNPDSVTICVQDSGPGIKLEDSEILFKPFISMKKEGMGMGLAICKKIIEAHGGTIWATNNPDRGAEFSFSLPIKREGNNEEG